MRPERYWLCWSGSQHAFHIEPEVRGLETNLSAFVLNRPSDFITVGVFSSRTEAQMFTNELRRRLVERGDMDREEL
jgi:hypothetical protein